LKTTAKKLGDQYIIGPPNLKLRDQSPRFLYGSCAYVGKIDLILAISLRLGSIQSGEEKNAPLVIIDVCSHYWPAGAVMAQMWSLMGCALVRVQPLQLVADHADKPETAGRCHVISVKSLTAPAADGRQSRSAEREGTTTNGVNAGSRDVAGKRVPGTWLR